MAKIIKNDTRFKSVNPPLTVTHPELIKEWSHEMNGELKPENFTLGSGKKIWWKCSKGDDHIWQAQISRRAITNQGCPICKNLKVVLSNCLFTTHPLIAKEWHPTKNNGLTPKDVVAGSDRRIWWQCDKDKSHEWQVGIYNRVSGSSCPFCANKRVALSNSLLMTHPEIAKQWHPSKNGKLTPDKLTAGSGKEVWWICKVNPEHEFKAIPNYLKQGSNCPICKNRRIGTSNSLFHTHPELAKEWHPTKNEGKLATEVVAGNNKKVWWKCGKGIDHEWQATINSRSSGNGCPFCANRQVSVTNSLSEMYPLLVKEWHPTKNGELLPSQVVFSSAQKVWWKCPKGEDHEWQTPVLKRTKNGSGCPICTNQKTVESNSLLSTYPVVASQWHKSKNGFLTPTELTGGSHRVVWWQCDKFKEHEWQTSPYSRCTLNTGCPYCSNQKVALNNSLFATHPLIAKQWHPTKNNDVTPKDVVAGSQKGAWWQCDQDTNHVWFTTPYFRAIRHTGCPYCNMGWTVEKIRLFVKSIKDNIHALTPAELYVIFQQNGLLTTDGKGKTFIKALATGTFPKEELEKFVNGETSLVNDFIANKEQTLVETLTSVDQEINTEIVDIVDQTAQKELPIIETKDVLAALNSQVISSADEEAVEFLLTSACAKIWKHAFVDEEKALEQANQYSGSSYADSVKGRFLEQYNGAKQLIIPDGYNFKIKGVLTQPNLMQRLIAYLVFDKKRVGNWSGTGAGKTLSAILASRVIDSKLTIICCPNAVVTGWSENISKIYPDSVVHIKTLQPKISVSDGKNHYLILNYETFQQENSEAEVKNLVDQYKADFIVIDEIHYSKQRVVEDMSKRKRIITGMVTSISQKNANLHVLGMSATPVINNLYEGKALLEMITGVHYDDLKTIPTVNNCMSLYQKLATHGIRWMPAYEQKLNLELIDIDCSDYVDEIKELGLKSSYVDLEGILTKAKLPEIRKRIKEKTIIYTHYLKNIIETLKTEIEKDGWKVAYFTGDDKSGLESFIHGDTDVLIASSSVGTGVDGLQHVCNRLIVNVLPWTHAEFEQLKGRIYRQGQTQQEVDIIVPLTHAEVNGEDWSWCKSKWDRIQFKKTIADAAVDGIVPEGHLRSPAQAYEDVMSWLKRLEEGKIHQIERRPIHIPLSDTVIQTRVRKFGDFSAMNRRINTSNSETTNKRFQENPEEWELYHALYREARKEWTTIPYEEIIEWCKKRPELAIGDFGCGEAKVAEALENTVYSFDHVAINDKVIAGDMSHVPLEDESLDVAIFSLSLMGTNFTDYIKEAHRCLKLDGILYIVEPTSKFNDLNEFIKGLESLGFDVFKPEEKYKFVFIRGIKSDRKLRNVELHF